MYGLDVNRLDCSGNDVMIACEHPEDRGMDDVAIGNLTERGFIHIRRQGNNTYHTL